VRLASVPTVPELLPIAVEAVDRASTMLRERSPGQITIKGDRDPATEVDYAIEREVRAFLLDVAPDVGFLGEEDGQFGNSDAGFMWALDPIDGTVNFIQGVPLCGVSLGLVHNERPVLGVIDLPFLNCRYSALDGAGAFRGTERIHARGERLADSIVAIGDYAVGEGSDAKNAERLRITSALASTVQRVRMFGSAAVDLAWVADGRIGGSVMLANKPWDTTAGVLLAREAGAIVSDLQGLPHSMRSTTTVAAGPNLHASLIAALGSNIN
jgi:myo-inositol-1(or 4)-monophosphatase